MSDPIVLTLFPPRGLDQSILVVVLTGMLVMVSTTEFFGWGFVGVVVPGYLASVLAIEPLTALVMFLEAMVTLVVARSLGSVLGRWGAWTTVFGRERFFLIVFVSILIRQHNQSWILPIVADWADKEFGAQLLVERRFFSLGLVCVPLLANMFWRLSFRVAMYRISVVVTITYVIVKYFFLPYTNLSLGNFELTYEHAALDFFSNAKAYIILLTTAQLGAVTNLRYGWDYNGIMVPALLALLWLTPAKLFATLFEALVILFLVRGALRLPLLRTANLEGPRKIVFVFSLGFFLKWSVGFAVGTSFPGLKVTDLFAFGYLLSSLLAVRMLQKKSVRRVMVPSLITSIAGFALGSLIGFVLDLWAPKEPVVAEEDQVAFESHRLGREELGALVLARLRADQVGAEPQQVDLRDLAAYGELWDHVQDWLLVPSYGSEQSVRQAALRAGMLVSPLTHGTMGDRQAFALFEREAETSIRGKANALLVPGAPGPFLEIPNPVTEIDLLPASLVLCEAIQCKGVLVPAGDVARSKNALDVQPAPVQRYFEIAHGHLAAVDRCELRSDFSVSERNPVLHVGGYLPRNMGAWTKVVGEPRLEWARPPVESAAYRRDRKMAVLRLRPRTANQLALSYVRSRIQVRDEESYQEGLARWRDRTLRPDHPYLAPSKAELVLLERFLAAPLFSAVSGEGMTELQQVRMVTFAGLVGFDLRRFDDCGAMQPCWVLADRFGPGAGGWGTLIVREGAAAPLVLEVPRPQRSLGSERLGLSLGQVTRARALLLAGADRGHDPHDPDPVRLGNVWTPFQAMHQALERVRVESPELYEMSVQVRGLAGWRQVEADVVVGVGEPALHAEQVPAAARRLFEPGQALDWVPTWMVSDGSPQLFPFSGAGVPQVEYSHALGGAPVITLWFSEELRRRFRSEALKSLDEALARVGLDRRVADEVQALMLDESGWQVQRGVDGGRRERRFRRAVTLALNYARTRHFHYLQRLRAVAERDEQIQVWSGQGAWLGAPFLAIELRDESERYRAVVGLSPELKDETLRLPVDEDLLDELAMEMAVRRALLQRVRSMEAHWVKQPGKGP